MKKEIGQNLIERACGGDMEAFGEIYFSLRDSIYGFAFRMTKKASVAEEITQEVFVFFIESPEKFKAMRGSLFPFLCGVARNKILNHLKKSGTRLEKNNFEDEEFENLTNGHRAGSPLKDLLDREFAGKVEECFLKLSPLQREVLVLREVEEMSYEEIAGIIEADTGVVRSRLYRARRSLARKLAPYLKAKEESVYEVH